MELVNRSDLKNIEAFTKSKIDWPKLSNLVKALEPNGPNSMGRLTEEEIRQFFIGKQWKPAVRNKIKQLGKHYGKVLQVVFDKSDGDCYFYITNV